MKTNNQNSKFARIDKILPQAAKHYHLEEVMQKHRALRSWQKVVVGFFDEAEKLTRAIDFKNGVLKVACLSQELAQKLKLLTPRIIEAMNKLLGRPLVYAIYLEV